MAFNSQRAANNTRSDASPRLVCEPWELIETDLPQDANIPVSESIFSVGNGHVGVRGFAEETDVSVPYNRSLGPTHRPLKTECTALALETVSPVNSLRGTYVNGIYEERLLTRKQRIFTVGLCARECFHIRVPDAFCIDVFVGSEHVSAATGTILSHTRVLDLRTGELRRQLVWLSMNQGREVTIESFRFASNTRPNIAAVKYTVTVKNVSNTDIRIVSKTTMPVDPHNHLQIENVVARQTLHDASSALCVRTRNSCKRLVVAATESCSTVQVDLSKGLPVAVSLGDSATSPSGPLAETSATVNLGSPSHLGTAAAATLLAPKCAETEVGAETIYTSVISHSTRVELTKYVAFLRGEDAAPEDISDLAIHHAREAAALGYEALFQEHRKAMAKFWDATDVRVKAAHPSVQGALRFSILQLYMSTGRGQLRGFPSRGLTGEHFGGHQQWDVDAFIVPFFSHTHPKLARALLQFRIDTLPQARNIAADMNLPRGALYPVRTVNGGENSPSSVCAAFLYVNAIIVYGMKQYVTATNDFSVMTSGGADVVFSTVIIWLIWGTWDKGEFHIRSVGGPDDYSGLIDNNLLTNLMAQYHMQWALELAICMQDKYPAEWESLKERCQITGDDLVMIEKAATKMSIIFDAKNRVHPVDQLFLCKKKWHVGNLKAERGFIRTFHPSVIYRHQVCRIPDVLLAAILLPDRFTNDEHRANYLFYESITTNDSSLSSVIFSVLAAQLGMADKAMYYFNRVLFMDIDNIIGNTGGGFHCSAAAGSWWCLAFGFAGMRVIQGALHLNPTIPEEWDEYQFSARHRGCLISVHVTRRSVIYTLVDGPEPNPELLIIHSGTKRIHLTKGIPESVHIFRHVQEFEFDCVLFDVDSLIEDIEEYHYEAWKQTLEEFFKNMGHMIEFTRELYLAYLKHGRPFPSLLHFLGKQGITNVPLGSPDDSMQKNTLHGLFHRKSHHFRNYVQSKGIRPREGALHLLSELRQSDIAAGCVTVSKNGNWLLNEIPQLHSLLDLCLDGLEGESLGLRWRPEMDYFSKCCKILNVASSRTIVVMEGINGFSKSALEEFSLVVDISKDPDDVNLSIPLLHVESLNKLSISMLDEETGRNISTVKCRRSRHSLRDFSLQPKIQLEKTLST